MAASSRLSALRGQDAFLRLIRRLLDLDELPFSSIRISIPFHVISDLTPLFLETERTIQYYIINVNVI